MNTKSPVEIQIKEKEIHVGNVDIENHIIDFRCLGEPG
jgi:hypothetical protein